MPFVGIGLYAFSNFEFFFAFKFKNKNDLPIGYKPRQNASLLQSPVSKIPHRRSHKRRKFRIGFSIFGQIPIVGQV